MSHTSEYGEYYVIHNGDYSGPIQIHLRTGVKDGVPSYELLASVPMWLLEHIVSAKLRAQRISELEQAIKDGCPLYD